VKWYSLAADQSEESAQFNLGLAYLYGRGVRENTTKGRELIRLAAQAGQPDAQKFLNRPYDPQYDTSNDPLEESRLRRQREMRETQIYREMLRREQDRNQ